MPKVEEITDETDFANTIKEYDASQYLVADSKEGMNGSNINKNSIQNQQ